jgi:hypothetical protein
MALERSLDDRRYRIGQPDRILTILRYWVGLFADYLAPKCRQSRRNPSPWNLTPDKRRFRLAVNFGEICNFCGLE